MDQNKGILSKRKSDKEHDVDLRPSTRPKRGVGVSWATDLCSYAVDNVLPPACTSKPDSGSLGTTDALVVSKEPFTCSLCLHSFKARSGVVVRECGHKFNKVCLSRHIKRSTTEEVCCPYYENGQKCQANLQHGEIQRLVGKRFYDEFIARNEKMAKERMGVDAASTRPEQEEKVEAASVMDSFDPAFWNMDGNPLVPNFESFLCPQCLQEIKTGDGVTLRDCGHNFCKQCLCVAIKISKAAEIFCPLTSQRKCEAKLQHREIKELVSAGEFDDFLQRTAYLAMHSYLDEEDIDIPDALLSNLHDFMCPICMEDIETERGVVLGCGHNFCRTCLGSHIKFSEGAEVVCPFIENDDKCGAVMLHREIRDLVSDVEFEAFLSRSERMAESQAEGSFHCKTPNCSGWCLYEDGVTIFTCPVCQHNNCINCAAIHEGVNCAAYQDSEFKKGTDPTNLYLQKELDKGNAMRCPKCKIIITKKYGCDYVECSMCRHGICWATKGSRWGPKGKGDTSAGCRCTVKRKCHPNCNYCH